MVVLFSSSDASSKKKLTAIDIHIIICAAIAVQLADSLVKTINPNDVKTDRLEIAKALEPIVQGFIYE